MNDLQKPVIEVQGGAYPRAIGFDKAAGTIYGQNHDAELITFRGDGSIRKTYDLGRNGDTRHLLVHPSGHKVIVLARPNLIVVNLPGD